MNVYRSLIVFLLVVVAVRTTKGQESNDGTLVIRSFLEEILVDSDYSVKEIATKYIEFEPALDQADEGLLQQRFQTLEKHLKKIKSQYSPYYRSCLPILSYSELETALQIPFDKGIRDAVYGVIFDPGKVMYFYLGTEKIRAFDLYMIKGSGKSARAYFLTY